MSQNRKADPNNKVAAENRKARFSYEVLDTLETGLVLSGTEVKSLRGGQANIQESYASVEGGELWLINSYLPEYLHAAAASCWCRSGNWHGWPRASSARA
jgi:SsrA-binding protein